MATAEHGSQTPSQRGNCPYCGSSRLVAAIVRPADGAPILRCSECNLLFLRDLPSDVPALYQGDYFEKGAAALGVSPAMGYSDYFQTFAVNFAWQLAMVRLAGGRGRLLDVGCASGRFLSLAVDGGFEAAGVELSTAAAAIAGNLGVPVSQMSFEQYAADRPFDVICAWEFIEHVPNLRETLAKARSLLAPGGCFLFSTPDAESPIARQRGAQWVGFTSSLEHLTFLTRRFLEPALSDLFGGPPLLLSFDHGEFSTLIGLARADGINEQDRRLGELIERRDHPHDPAELARIGESLAWIYLQLEQHDAAERTVAALEAQRHDAASVLRAAFLLAKGKAAEAARLLDGVTRRARPTSQLFQWLALAERAEKGNLFHSLQDNLQETQETQKRAAREVDDLKAQIYKLNQSASFRIGRRITQVLEKMPLAQPVWNGLDAVSRGEATQVARNVVRRVQRRLDERQDRAARRARAAASARRWPCRTAAEVGELVSVVLPVYNQASLLRDSVASVLAQTYPHFELILINDGSTDGVERVLDEFVADPRVRIVTQHNQGLPKALSNGFELARGEFWTWTSADNLMRPDQLADLVAFLRKEQAAGMVFADYLAIDDEGRPLTDPNFRPHNRRSPRSPEIHLPHDVESLNTVQDNFIGPCFLYRGWIGLVLGEYDPAMGVEDYDYWMRLNDLFVLRHLGTDKLLYDYRVHANTLTTRAAEFKIGNKVEWLMRYQQTRHAFYQRPATVFADADTRAWLRRLSTAPHRVVRWNGGALAGGGDKRVLLTSAAHLARLESHPPETCVVAWIDRPEMAYAHRVELARLADMCVAADDESAARLALFQPRSFRVAPGQALFDLALAYANNQLFYQRTRPPNERLRRPPEVYSSAPLRVLLQVDDFVQGGMEQVVMDVATALQRERIEVSLLILGRQGSAAAQMRAAGVRVVEIGPDSDAGESRIAAYERLLREERIDLVNAHYSIFGAPRCAQAGIPFVQTIHNTYTWLRPEQIEEWQAADAHTAAYLCVSASTAFYSDARLGLDVDKMVVVENGVDAARLAPLATAERNQQRAHFGLTPDHFVFVHVASLIAPKAQLPLVEAFADVVRVHPQARLLLVGRTMEEAYADRVRNAVTKHGLTQHVLFVGHKEDVAPLYGLADAFVLPSFWEGWSLALAEALLAGLPVIASDVGAAREVLAEAGGTLIPPPFASIAKVDWGNERRWIEERDPRFLSALTAAMKKALVSPERPCVSDALRRRWDRAHAYRAYARVFRWIVGGGDVASARTWLARHADPGQLQ